MYNITFIDLGVELQKPCYLILLYTKTDGHTRMKSLIIVFVL